MEDLGSSNQRGVAPSNTHAGSKQIWYQHSAWIDHRPMRVTDVVGVTLCSSLRLKTREAVRFLCRRAAPGGRSMAARRVSQRLRRRLGAPVTLAPTTGCFLLLFLALKLQTSQAAFTCSGGYSSCPDQNLQVLLFFVRCSCNMISTIYTGAITCATCGDNTLAQHT